MPEPVKIETELEDFFKSKDQVPAEPAIATPVPTPAPVEPVAPVEPAAAAPVVPAEPPEEPQDDLIGFSDAELRGLVRGLRSTVDNAHGRLVARDTIPAPDTTTTTTGQLEIKPVGVVPGATPPTEKEVVTTLNFLKDINMDDVVDNADALNRVLVAVYNKATTDAESRAVEKVLRSIPQLVVNYASRHATMAETVREFYGKNPDLAPVRRTVAAVANEVASEHPDWAVSLVFDEAATRSRKLLGLKASSVVSPAGGVTPAFVKPGASGRRKATDTGLTAVQKEIAELI